MKYIISIMIAITQIACEGNQEDDHRLSQKDSTLIMKTILTDSSFHKYLILDDYKKRDVPISFKSMSLIESIKPKGGYHTNFTSGNFTRKDTLYIFNEFKNTSPSSTKVIVSVPSEGVKANYFLTKVQEKWNIVKDSTDVYEN